MIIIEMSNMTAEDAMKEKEKGNALVINDGEVKGIEKED